jgi:hypothetical protein
VKTNSYYILVASRAYSVDEVWIGSEEMARRRLAAQKWGLYENTPHKAEIVTGDTLIIYIAGPRRMQFVARAEAGAIEFDTKSYDADGDALTTRPFAVLTLRNAETFPVPVSIAEVKDKLDFVPKNTPKWGAVLQRGAKKISASDAAVILREANCGDAKPGRK